MKIYINISIAIFMIPLVYAGDLYKPEEMGPVKRKAFDACSRIHSLADQYEKTKTVEDLQKVADAYSTCVRAIRLKIRVFPMATVSLSSQQHVSDTLESMKEEAEICVNLLQSKTPPVNGSRLLDAQNNIYKLADVEYDINPSN